MKKIFMTVMLCALAMTGVTCYAQSTAKQLKTERKAVEARVKELSKEGWKSLQSAGLATVIAEHNAKLKNNPDLMEFVGTAEGSKTTNIGKSKARNSAITDYAEYCSGELRSRIVSDLHDIEEEQADNLVSGFERILSQKLEKDLKPSYYIYREINGKYDVRGFFLVDESVVVEKLEEAIKEASERSKIANEHAIGISDFIKQGSNQ